MKFDIVTLFPTYFSTPLQESLLGKAIKNKLLEVNLHNLRDYSHHPRQQVDDTPYGGGAGMVLKADVLSEAVKSLKGKSTKVILTDPAGVTFNQELAEELSKEGHLVVICGRYEGVDQRFKDKYVDMEISIGDYILNGGEVATLVILETISRLIPGVLGTKESLSQESFTKQALDGVKEVRLLEYPHYTRPEVFEGESVPKVLLSGNHAEIKSWRLEKALEKTKSVRPDLIS